MWESRDPLLEFWDPLISRAGGSHSGTQTRRNRIEGTSVDAAVVHMTDADQNREEVGAPIRRIFSAKEITRIGTWNQGC